MDLARQLHSVDFQLITPTGHLYLKDQYLGEIETGQLKYRSLAGCLVAGDRNQMDGS